MSPKIVHALEPFDFGGIAAVGFDLDHTLAVYDDERVNALAYEETCTLLADRGYPPSSLAAPYDETQVCRGLVIDTAAGCVVKPDARGAVMRARRSLRWLPGARIATTVDASKRFHGIHSPFDLPTAFLFQQMDGNATAGGDHARLLSEIRHDLDCVHTRGELKSRIVSRMDQLVHPVRDNAAAFFRLRQSGKRLFVITNSETHYTVAVLDHLFGRGVWPELFDVVVTRSGKPAMFDTSRRAQPVHKDGVVEGAAAAHVESLVGARGRSVMYIGDNPAFDAEPARRFGWTAALVVPELVASEGVWGSPLRDGPRPTWFSRLITRSAHVYAIDVDCFLGLEPDAVLEAGPHPLAGASESA